MNFDKWFEEQERLVKIIFLFIPIVGWVIEVLVRLSAMIRNSSTMNILGFVIFLIGGYFFQFVDLIYLCITDELLIIE